MSAANPNPMEKSIVSVFVVENAGGGGRRCRYLSGDYGIMPRAMIGEIRGSYGDDATIDRRSHSFVWEEEGRGCRDGYGVGEMLSFVRFV
jgi:hypothetical protein